MEVDDLFDEAADGSFVVSVHAQPGARTDAVVGRHGSALKIRVRAPADKGRANSAVTAALAEALGVAPAQVTLVGGAANRSKRFRIEGCSRAHLRRSLQRLLGS